MAKRDEVDLYGQDTVFRETGYYLNNRDLVDASIPLFDQAIIYTPNDKRALIGRSCARAKLCEYPGALRDINKALEIDPRDLVTLAHKALNTYLSCDFEDALVMNQRMTVLRKKPDNFTMGVLHCKEAIENCIGTRVGRPLRDYFKIIRKLAWKKERELEKPYEPKSKHKKKKNKAKKQEKSKEPVVPKLKSKIGTKTELESVSEVFSDTQFITRFSKPNLPDLCPKDEQGEDLVIRDSLHTLKTESDYVPPLKQALLHKPLQNYTSNINNYMSEKYLNAMYVDKIFLKNLPCDPGLRCPNEAGNKKLLKLTNDGYKMLSFKQELLRARRPFYFLKYQEARVTGAFKKRQDAELKKVQNMAKSTADKLFKTIYTAIKEKKTKVALEFSEKLKEFCDSKPKKILPMRETYLGKMYKLVARAYYDLFRINKEQSEVDQEKRVCFLLGIHLDKEPSTDSVIEQFRGQFVDWKKSISIAENRLRLAQSPEEMCWLYHELSRLHSEVKQFEHARVYARKCITQGRIANNYQWVMNAKMMITRIDMLQHNKNDAKYELHEALKLARRMMNPIVEEFIEKCLEVVEKIELEEFVGPKVLEKREQEIVAMVQTDLKDEVAFLFKKMSAMPATRRMCVLPGVTLEQPGEKLSPSALKMTILPVAKTEDERMEVKMPGSPKKEKSDTVKGVAFMELIQYHLD